MRTSTIKKQLRNAGIQLEGITINRNEIKIYIEDTQDEGYADREKTEALKDQVISAVGFGGYRAGSGAYILRPDYTLNNEDFMDKGSRYHY